MEHQGGDAALAEDGKDSRRTSLAGLSGLFGRQFNLWEARASGDDAEPADAEGRPRATGAGGACGFGGKMKRLLSPKPSRRHDVLHASSADFPVPSAEEMYSDGSEHAAGGGRSPSNPLAQSWPTPGGQPGGGSPPSGNKSLWKKLVDPSKGKGSPLGPMVIPGDDLSEGSPSPYGSPSKSAPSRNTERGASDACSSGLEGEGAVHGDADSYYSYDSPTRGGGHRHGGLADQTIDLNAQACLFPNDDMGPNTPGMVGMAELDAAGLTPSFLGFGSQLAADLGAARSAASTPLEDQTLVLVAGADLARTGAPGGFRQSPMLFPGGGLAALEEDELAMAGGGGTPAPRGPQAGSPLAGMVGVDSLAARVQTLLTPDAKQARMADDDAEPMDVSPCPGMPAQQGEGSHPRAEEEAGLSPAAASPPAAAATPAVAAAAPAEAAAAASEPADATHAASAASSAVPEAEGEAAEADVAPAAGAAAEEGESAELPAEAACGEADGTPVRGLVQAAAATQAAGGGSEQPITADVEDGASMVAEAGSVVGEVSCETLPAEAAGPSDPVDDDAGTPLSPSSATAAASPGFGFASHGHAVEAATPSPIQAAAASAPSPTMTLSGADHGDFSLLDEESDELLGGMALPPEEGEPGMVPSLCTSPPATDDELQQPRSSSQRRSAVRESIPLFVAKQGGAQAQTGMAAAEGSLDDERLEDLAPRGGGARRMASGSKLAGSSARCLTPVEEGSQGGSPPSAGGSAGARGGIAPAAPGSASPAAGQPRRLSASLTPMGSADSGMQESGGRSPSLALAGGMATPAREQGGAAGGPSLLDPAAASPSILYGMQLTQTPYRQMAALPLDQALAAPLVDSSPFTLDDVDTICLADEAKRLAQSLAPAMAAAAAGPGSGPRGGVAGGPQEDSPSAQLREMHVQMLTKQLTDSEARCAELEQLTETLRDQVEGLRFDRQAAESNDEFERDARLYAEEQMRAAQGELARLQGKLAEKQAALAAALDQANQLREQELAASEERQRERSEFEGHVKQARLERNTALDKVAAADIKLTALQNANADLQAALGAEQLRGVELQEALAAKEAEVQDAARMQGERGQQLERAMEQLIAAQTSREHANRKAMEDHQRIAALSQQVQQAMAEREAAVQEAALLRQKYAQRTAQAKELQGRVQAKEQENSELMAMCDQLMALQEGAKK